MSVRLRICVKGAVESVGSLGLAQVCSESFLESQMARCPSGWSESPACAQIPILNAFCLVLELLLNLTEAHFVLSVESTTSNQMVLDAWFIMCA